MQADRGGLGINETEKEDEMTTYTEYHRKALVDPIGVLERMTYLDEGADHE